MTLLAPRQRTRFLLVALMLSILIHLAGGGLWSLLAHKLPQPVIRMGSLRETPPPEVDVIRLEQRAPAPRHQAHENRAIAVAPRAHPIATAQPALPRPRHEIARIRNDAPAQPPPVRGAIAFTAPRRIRPAAPPAVHDAKPAFSDRQIARLGESFSQTIADSRETLGSVQAASERTTVTTIKHYATSFSGLHEGMNPGDGDIFPISHQRIGATMWYYARYTYMHADGTYEADEIPWPMHYPVNDDPFARHDKRVPIQPPPEGFKPDRPLKPILAQFFGGPPVTD